MDPSDIRIVPTATPTPTTNHEALAALREKILNADDRPVLGPIHVPEWGLDVWIRTIYLSEQLEAERNLERGVADVSKLCARGLSDAQGNRIFSDRDCKRLNDKHPGVIARLGRLVAQHNKIREEDLEREEKKYATPGPSGSPSDSRDNSAGA